MKHNTFLVKPASSLCNLRCRYCFYDDVSNSRACKNMGLLSHEMAGELVEKAFAATEEGGSVHFLFQGGEPTLAGLDFFRFFLETERSMQRNISVFHSIQTNGICLDEEWASFFKANSFLVGLSLDGTQENHDLYRLDAAGQGTWDKVTHALALLDVYRVETNLLCVVTGQLARKPQRAFKSLCELGQHNLQFIPCLDPLDTIGGQAYSLTPELYGRFLCGVFDTWYQQLQRGNYISVRNFEDYLRILLGMPPTSCASSGSCGHYLAVEGDGSLYPCDFYVLDEWKLGNLSHCTVEGGIPGYRARIRPIVSRITIHWPSFYNVVTGKTLALPNLIALQHIPLSPAGVIAKRPAPIALPNSCAAEWRMAPDAVFSPYASVRYFTPHMVHSQYNLL